SGSGNAPAIDLLDSTPGREIAFQITSTSSLEKVKDTIRKFFSAGIYRKAGRLKIFIITSRLDEYSQKIIDEVVQKELSILKKGGKNSKIADITFTFNAEEDILDGRTLLKELDRQNDHKKIQDVERLLKRQFDLADERQSLDVYYSGLNSMFYEVVMEDGQGMTLSQMYVDPSFAVTRSVIRQDHPTLKSDGGK